MASECSLLTRNLRTRDALPQRGNSALVQPAQPTPPIHKPAWASSSTHNIYSTCRETGWVFHLTSRAGHRPGPHVGAMAAVGPQAVALLAAALCVFSTLGVAQVCLGVYVRCYLWRAISLRLRIVPSTPSPLTGSLRLDLCRPAHRQDSQVSSRMAIMFNSRIALPWVSTACWPKTDHPPCPIHAAACLT